MGLNVRYGAIVALGMAGTTAAGSIFDLAAIVEESARRVLRGRDVGAVALAAWAAAEITGKVPADLLDRLVQEARAETPLPTVDHAWLLTALVAARDQLDVTAEIGRAVGRLLAAQGRGGLFPHVLPAKSQRWYRSHVACFADQVYPVQALSRVAAIGGDPRALAAADQCAAQIVALQGAGGQWWWHYDHRSGSVIEPYPVYSVHQHAMAPMTLFELQEAGGADHTAAIDAGLRWLTDPPERAGELLDRATGLIWRKVGRREPSKLVRSVRSITTAAMPSMHWGVLDAVFPPSIVDRECRPYELGWLLYAWRPQWESNDAGPAARHGWAR